MQSVEATCSHCKNTVVVDDASLFGEDVTCPVCEESLYVPLPESGEEFIENPHSGERKAMLDYSKQAQAELKSLPQEDKKRCPFCKEIIQKAAVKCRHCGEMLNGSTSRSGDKLEGYWIAIIWCSLFIPCIGGWVVVLLSSIMYYVWKKDYPQKAKQINMHGWLAFLLGNAIGIAFWILMGGIAAAN